VKPKRFVAFIILGQHIRDVIPKRLVGLHDNSRELMGTNGYPSPEILAHNIRHARLVKPKRLVGPRNNPICFEATNEILTHHYKGCDTEKAWVGFEMFYKTLPA